MNDLILDIKGLTVSSRQRGREKILVDNVSFDIKPGECMAILGESGSGKSMTVKAILGLLDRNFDVVGQAVFKNIDLLQATKENLRRMRGRQITMVLQNPMTCFDPLCRVGEQITETFDAHLNLNKRETEVKAIELLHKMMIRDPEEVMEKYPHQLSGGMLQRIMIGVAMALEPDLLIADEPTTAIDAITQYEILEEFSRIKAGNRTSLIFITHDLGAVSKLADRVVVMNRGRIVDRGDFQHILNHASDPYTRLLVDKKRAVMQRYRQIVDAPAAGWESEALA